MTKNMSDDELVARLRTTFESVASRTPVGPSRSPALLSPPGSGPRPRTLVAVGSAAAAVTAIAVVAGVTANAHSGSSGRVGTVAPLSSDGVTPTPTASPGGAGSAAGCVPENYYVIASAQQLQGLTYLLPSVPAGYHLYGAWGTVSRNGCADSATWYVEYDHDGTTNPPGANAIQLEVTHATADADAGRTPSQQLAGSAQPSTSGPAAAAATASASAPAIGSPIDLAGVLGRYVGGKGGTGTLIWSIDGLTFDLTAPTNGDDPAALGAIARSLVAVSPDDPRIVAPANCRVPAGQVCESPSSQPPATSTESPTASPSGG
jgi:hypothetical protein